MSAIPHLSLIDNAMNKGKGAVVRQGMLTARGDIRLFFDADNSTSIDQFTNMLPYFAEKTHDVIIGSRAVRGAVLNPSQPWYRVFLGKGSNLIFQALLTPRIWDTQCGFKAFTATAAEKIFRRARVDGWGFDAEALALARRFGFAIKEIPVHWANSPFSHVRPSAYLKVLSETITIRLWLWKGEYD